MTTRDFTANVISATKVVPDGNFKTSAASGVWDINEALDLIKVGNWPNAANIDPAAFVDGLFSTDLWTSDGSSTQTITNNIDLSNKGGLVWIKDRSTARNHVLFDTERVSGTTDNYITTVSTDAQVAHTNEFGDFTSTGYTLPRNTEAGYTNTNTGRNYVGWTFRKQPKFFDVVTYTGTGVNGRTVSHNLGAAPGMIIVKQTSASGEPWYVYHRSLGATKRIYLSSNSAVATSDDGFYNTEPTSTEFTVAYNGTNKVSESYVAYVFAHNNSDGGFGESGDQDIIKCANYTGDGVIDGPSVNVGFEPQWLLIRRTDASGDWRIIDIMRGMAGQNSGTQDSLKANSTDADSAENVLIATPTGFKINSNSAIFNAENGNYIYMAIRRGGMQTPTAASDVFAVAARTGASGNQGAYRSGFPVDMAFHKVVNNSINPYEIGSRLTQNRSLNTTDTSAEATQSDQQYDFMDGWNNETSSSSTKYAWMWKRAKGYFDVVAYTGNGTAGRTVTHNLGVAPDMMWIKNRDDQYNDWEVYVSGITHLSVNGSDPDSYGSNPATLRLNKTDAPNFSMSGTWNHTHPTSSVFTLGDTSSTNGNGEDLIAYLFATLAGVSKVGSFTGTTSDQTIDCGFSSGARFVLIKLVSGSGDWVFWDSTRGIVSGNDPYLLLNSTAAEVTNTDFIDSHSSGFTVTASYQNNLSKYIFYAIA